ncbi:MAG TPA: hypothetical protein VF624_09160 [Tepidisphaeraceae bacterium]
MSDYRLIWLSLLAILVASSLMLMQLLRRHTGGRERFKKWEWSINRGFRRGEPGVVQIEGLDDIRHHTLRALEHYVRRRDGVAIYKIHSVGPNDRVQTWHLLTHVVDGYSAPIALRPTAATVSVIDLMGLTQFPKLSTESRFAVYGLRATDARELVAGPVRALIPPDIGLILSADQLILDFTLRPFDTVEFSRVLAVAEQLKTIV